MKSRFKKLLLFSIVLFSSLPNYSQELPREELLKDITRSFTPEELMEDLNIVKKELLRIHPDIFLYSDKDIFMEYFRNCKDSLKTEKTSIQFYRLLTPMLPLIANGHTLINTSKSYRSAIVSILPRFPFIVRWKEDKLYVLRNMSNNEDIKTGDVITKINGKAVSDIVALLKNNITRDGYNETAPYRTISLNFSGVYAEIIGVPEKFVLEYFSKNEILKSTEIDGLSRAAQVKEEEKRYGNSYHAIIKEKAPLEFVIRNGVGFLSIATFNTNTFKDNDIKYKIFFKSVFKKLRKQKVRDLIIDLRENQGGFSEPVIEILRYFSSSSFAIDRSVYTAINKRPHEEYFVKDRSWESVGDMVFSYNGSTYDRDQFFTLYDVVPHRNIYTGALYLLIGGGTNSAACDFASLVKEKRNAIFIGNETGGNPNHSVSGNRLKIILPNTKVRLEIPITAFTKNVNFDTEGHGIIPRYMVTNSFHDEVTHNDRVIEFAKDLIKKSE